MHACQLLLTSQFLRASTTTQEAIVRLPAAFEDYCEYGRFDAEVRHDHTTFLGYRNRLQQFQKWYVDQGLGDPSVRYSQKVGK